MWIIFCHLQCVFISQLFHMKDSIYRFTEQKRSRAPLSQSDHNSQSLLITAGRFSCVSFLLSTVEVFIHRFVLDSLTVQKQMQLSVYSTTIYKINFQYSMELINYAVPFFLTVKYKIVHK